MGDPVKVRVEFELTQDQARMLQEVMDRERVTAGEACRILIVHHVTASQAEAKAGIQRRLPRPPVSSQQRPVHLSSGNPALRASDPRRFGRDRP